MVMVLPLRRLFAITSPFYTLAFRSTTTLSASMNNGDINCNIQKIGIIGGGAAGLATARQFLKANEYNNPNSVKFEVTILESRNEVGGIWKYEEDETKTRPMYRSLRTNLPKQLMAYKELPWGSGDGSEPSYVSHSEVQQYLQDYAKEFSLLKHIRFGCTVDQLKVLQDDQKKGENGCDTWPQISLEWTDNTTNQSHKQTFDSVCICNGHYTQPSSPKINGIGNFSGTIEHAISYDNPNKYAGKTVLCIGARASGADIAREIATVAKRVYLSDSTCDKKQDYDTVVLMPRTQSIDENGHIHFSSSSKNELTVNDVDVIIFCSGYDYSFPFIDDESNLDLQNIPGERRIKPLYEQLWHAQYPSLSFIGLPLSVVPFPLFEIQGSAVVSQLTSRPGSISLPSLSERMAAAEKDASSGGPSSPGRVVDTHFLGSFQWQYSRRLAKIGGVYDEDMENYIATNKAMYDRSGKERKSMTPGGDDIYRETIFRREDEKQSYQILSTKLEPVRVETTVS